MKKEPFSLEKSLKKIKDAELDIELLKRDNEKTCAVNDLKIREFEEVIAKTELILEAELKRSGENKLECKLGSIVFKMMPDKWTYQDEILMAWIISLPGKIKKLYLKVKTTVKTLELKNRIIADNEILFENNKLVDDDTGNVKLFLVEEEKDFELIGPRRDHKVEGIKIEHQDPKFSYTIKNLKKWGIVVLNLRKLRRTLENHIKCENWDRPTKDINKSIVIKRKKKIFLEETPNGDIKRKRKNIIYIEIKE